MLNKPFEYQAAFSRNIGWITHQEQDTLKSKRIAIVGLSGVVGSHLLTLARLGGGAFHVADFDKFEQPNFNQHVGAAVSHLCRPKTDV